MSIAALNIISNAMKELGLKYKFMTFKVDGATHPKTYFVGEYQEISSINEDGMQETSFMITGFSRESWLVLEEAKEKIESYFSKVGGKTAITEAGSAVAVFYSNSLVVPTGDAELKKIQINLIVKEWSVK
jgi:hypothetical protein